MSSIVTITVYTCEIIEIYNCRGQQKAGNVTESLVPDTKKMIKVKVLHIVIKQKYFESHSETPHMDEILQN